MPPDSLFPGARPQDGGLKLLRMGERVNFDFDLPEKKEHQRWACFSSLSQDEGPLGMSELRKRM